MTLKLKQKKMKQLKMHTLKVHRSTSNETTLVSEIFKYN